MPPKDMIFTKTEADTVAKTAVTGFGASIAKSAGDASKKWLEGGVIRNYVDDLGRVVTELNGVVLRVAQEGAKTVEEAKKRGMGVENVPQVKTTEKAGFAQYPEDLVTPLVTTETVKPAADVIVDGFQLGANAVKSAGEGAGQTVGSSIVAAAEA